MNIVDTAPVLYQVFSLIRELWHTDLLSLLLNLLYNLVSPLTTLQLLTHVSSLVYDLLQLIQSDSQVEEALKVLGALKGSLNSYLHLVLPAVATVVTTNSVVRLVGLDVLNIVIRSCEVNDYATAIVHPIVTALRDCHFENTNTSQTSPTSSTTYKTERLVAMDRKERMEHKLLRKVVTTLTSLVYRLGHEYCIYSTLVSKVLDEAVEAVFTKPNEDDAMLLQNYKSLVCRVLKGQALDKPVWLRHTPGEYTQEFIPISSQYKPVHHSTTQYNHSMNVSSLREAWDATQQSTEEDWAEWMRRFSLELMKESPQQSIRACYRLAQVHEQLGLDLLNPGRACCRMCCMVLKLLKSFCFALFLFFKNP